MNTPSRDVLFAGVNCRGSFCRRLPPSYGTPSRGVIRPVTGSFGLVRTAALAGIPSASQNRSPSSSSAATGLGAPQCCLLLRSMRHGRPSRARQRAASLGLLGNGPTTLARRLGYPGTRSSEPARRIRAPLSLATAVLVLREDTLDRQWRVLYHETFGTPRAYARSIT